MSTKNTLSTTALLAAAVMAYTSQSCTTSHEDNVGSTDSWDDKAASKDAPLLQNSVGENQNDKWGVNEYVKRYEDGMADPENKEVFQDPQGNKFIQIDVPAKTFDKNAGDESVKVFKQLEGDKTVPVSDSTAHHYHGSGGYIWWYHYYGTQAYGVHPYYGYYTPRSASVHQSGMRASNHLAMMHNNKAGITKFHQPAHSKFALNTKSISHPHRVSGSRGHFGKSGMRSGGGRSFGA